MGKPDLKVIEGGDEPELEERDQKILDGLRDWMGRRGCKAVATDAQNNHISFLDPAAHEIKIYSPANEFYYSVKSAIQRVAPEAGIEMDEEMPARISRHILAMARYHAMKGDL